MSRLTRQEWTTAYVLRFGREQVRTSGYLEGEQEFLIEMHHDLLDDPDPKVCGMNSLAVLIETLREQEGALS